MTSYIIVKSDILKTMCLRAIENIKCARDKAIKNEAEIAAEDRNNGFLHKLFKRKEWTPERILQETTDVDVWIIRKMRYGLVYSIAYNLLMASGANDEVHVSVQDYADLNSWQ